MRAASHASTLLLLLLASCAHGAATHAAPSASDDPCRGSQLDLDAAAAHCRVDAPDATPPAREALTAQVETTTLRSGEVGRVPITFTNVTSAPLDVVIPAGRELSATIWRGDERADQRVEAMFDLLAALSGCNGNDAACRAIRVTLEPGGVLHASVEVRARITVLQAAPDTGTDTDASGVVSELVESDGGPVPPGEYTLRVALPWSDPDPAYGGTHIGRETSGTITLTP